MDEPPVLVTGATGTVGSTVVKALAEREVPVRAAVRDVETAREQLGEYPGYVAFDFAKPETWRRAFEGVERLFLMRPPTAGSKTLASAVDATVRVGVEHIVYLSVLGADRNVLIPHHRIEGHLEDSDAASTFLRASFFMQNLAEVHRRDIVERDEIFVPAGKGCTSFVDARDIGAVAATVFEESDHENCIYDLTGAVSLDYDEVAAVFSSVLDRPISYANPSILEFVRRMHSRGHPLPFIAVMVGIYTTARFGLSARVNDDLERVLDREFSTFLLLVRHEVSRWNGNYCTGRRDNGRNRWSSASPASGSWYRRWATASSSRYLRPSSFRSFRATRLPSLTDRQDTSGIGKWTESTPRHPLPFDERVRADSDFRGRQRNCSGTI